MKFTGQKISNEEAAQLYSALPDLSAATEEEVRAGILSVLSQQARQKKLAALQQQWRELTGSESPASWSEEMRTPIQWVLELSLIHILAT